MMEMEFKTTRQIGGGRRPIPPDGDSWSLAGVNNVGINGDVYMYWQRPKDRNPRACSDCPSIAFTHDGFCIGCGTKYVRRS